MKNNIISIATSVILYDNCLNETKSNLEDFLINCAFENVSILGIVEIGVTYILGCKVYRIIAEAQDTYKDKKLREVCFYFLPKQNRFVLSEDYLEFLGISLESTYDPISSFLTA